MSSSQEFEKELRDTFLEECEQLLEQAEKYFVALDNCDSSAEIIDSIFRLAHSFKGGANAVGFTDLAHFAHAFESFITRFKKQELSLSPSAVSLLLKCNDFLRDATSRLKLDPSAALRGDELLEQMEAFSEISTNPSQDKGRRSLEGGSTSSSNQVEVASRSQQVETTPAAPLHKGAAAPRVASSSSQIRVNLQTLERLFDSVGEAAIVHSMLQRTLNSANDPEADASLSQMGKMVRDLQDLSMGLRLTPIQPLMHKLKRIVRDAALELGKEVDFQIEGEDTAVERAIMEQLADPMIHLIRNAVDHGIEAPDVRLSKNKPAKGTIRLSAENQGGVIVIQIKDDGGGIDPKRLVAIAIEKNILSENTQLSDAEAYQLIFLPGFSTKKEVTELSGRGVGMDVVKTNIESLRGQISIQSKPGVGTTFSISLPLSLALIDCMVVRCDEDRYYVPLTQIFESLDLSRLERNRLPRHEQYIHVRGENIPLFNLKTLLGKRVSEVGKGTVIVVRRENKAVSILVDAVEGRHQAVTKTLGAELSHLREFSGATIASDGKPVLILDLNKLIEARVTNV